MKLETLETTSFPPLVKGMLGTVWYFVTVTMFEPER